VFVCFVRSRSLPSGGVVRPFRSSLLSLQRWDKAGTCPTPRRPAGWPGGLALPRRWPHTPGRLLSEAQVPPATARTCWPDPGVSRPVEQLEQPARNPQHEDFSLWQAAENLFQLFRAVYVPAERGPSGSGSSRCFRAATAGSDLLENHVENTSRKQWTRRDTKSPRPSPRHPRAPRGDITPKRP
jgi:hypothetical protein